MSILTLAEAKIHLRVDQSTEDTTIQIYIDAATEYVENFLNRQVPGMNESPQYIPSSIKSAALLIVGDLYENREGAGEKDIKENPAVMRLLYPYRVGIGI